MTGAFFIAAKKVSGEKSAVIAAPVITLLPLLSPVPDR
ncbi:hypothetical protein CSC35_2095 [Enterobacter hormaechei]|nr:hypothetical protein CSC35_2095 [Enterobacter hormaechei]